MGYHAKWDTIAKWDTHAKWDSHALRDTRATKGSSWAKLGSGVADLAEVAAGVDLVRVEVADHLDVVRREELERAEHLAAAQTHKHTTDNVRDPSKASEALQPRRRQARTSTCGSWRLLFRCFVAYPYRYSDYPNCYSDCLRLSVPSFRLPVPLFQFSVPLFRLTRTAVRVTRQY